jgi:hypothetical protein
VKVRFIAAALAWGRGGLSWTSILKNPLKHSIPEEVASLPFPTFPHYPEIASVDE